jgi:hypothetical protein
MVIRVECLSDDHGEPLPVALWLGERRLQVQAVVDRWFAPTQRWFRVATDDQQLYVVRLDEASGTWDLVALTRQAEPEVPVHLAARTPRATH